MKEKTKISIQPTMTPYTLESFVNVYIEDKHFQFTANEFKLLESKIENQKAINSLCKINDIVSEQKDFIQKININGNLDSAYNLMLWFNMLVDRQLYNICETNE